MAIFSPSRRSQSRRQAQILILKILQCILAVKFFAFLDLAKNLSFSDSLLYDKKEDLNCSERGIL